MSLGGADLHCRRISTLGQQVLALRQYPPNVKYTPRLVEILSNLHHCGMLSYD